ncbi:FAD-dependent oxidoreductase [Pseudomonas sp. Pseusp122]|uniref:FAD-dependent oxidoreductase n=1 Tax=unclassified Pseudomonas TaxID=196821 RepID=UPI0039A4B5A9
MTFHAVADLNRLTDAHPLRVKAGCAEVVLLSNANQIHAFQANCPHAGAPLEKGAICEGYLICPWHKAAFAIDSGEVCEPPALASLERHAVRIEGSTVWVDDQPLPCADKPAEPDNRCFVVIGAGAAGSAAVAALRAKGYTGQLLWIDQEQRSAYDRTALSKFVLAGEMPPTQVPSLLEDSFYQTEQIQRLHGRVPRVDSHTKTISLEDGRSLIYDAALLATGGIAQRPQIEGAHLPGVFVLRSLADAQQLLSVAVANARVTIIGDSFIGLEAAAALRKAGLEVHVVARHEVPFQKQMGERIGRALRTLHERNGVVFHTGTEPILLEGAAKVNAVVLANGERLETDLVLIGTGVTPATEPARELALADDHSLCADADMRVADGLWAAGDMVTFPLAGRPVRIEHWRVAQQQARIAASNMLGEQREFADVPFFWTYHYGKTYEVLGYARDWNRIEYVGEPEQYAFIALLCVDDQVESVVACGRQRIMALLSQRMKRALSCDEAMLITAS